MRCVCACLSCMPEIHCTVGRAVCLSLRPCMSPGCRLVPGWLSGVRRSRVHPGFHLPDQQRRLRAYFLNSHLSSPEQMRAVAAGCFLKPPLRLHDARTRLRRALTIQSQEAPCAVRAAGFNQQQDCWACIVLTQNLAVTSSRLFESSAGPCPPGYSGSGSTGCVDADGCTAAVNRKQPCIPGVPCIPTPCYPNVPCTVRKHSHHAGSLHCRKESIRPLSSLT